MSSWRVHLCNITDRAPRVAGAMKSAWLAAAARPITRHATPITVSELHPSVSVPGKKKSHAIAADYSGG